MKRLSLLVVVVCICFLASAVVMAAGQDAWWVVKHDKGPCHVMKVTGSEVVRGAVAGPFKTEADATTGMKAASGCRNDTFKISK